MAALHHESRENYLKLASVPELSFQREPWDDPDDLTREKSLKVYELGHPDASITRQLKRIWNAEADHESFKRTVKVHWTENIESMTLFLKGSSKDEVSTTLYKRLTGSEVRHRGAWGHIGAQLEGRVTFATDDMDALVSLSRGSILQYGGERTGSGLPRRPTMHSSRYDTYVITSMADLDDPRHPLSPGVAINEALLDNWHLVGFVYFRSNFTSTFGESEPAVQRSKQEIDSLKSMAKQRGVALKVLG